MADERLRVVGLTDRTYHLPCPIEPDELRLRRSGAVHDVAARRCTERRVAGQAGIDQHFRGNGHGLSLDAEIVRGQSPRKQAAITYDQELIGWHERKRGLSIRDFSHGAVVE